MDTLTVRENLLPAPLPPGFTLDPPDAKLFRVGTFGQSDKLDKEYSVKFGLYDRKAGIGFALYFVDRPSTLVVDTLRCGLRAHSRITFPSKGFYALASDPELKKAAVWAIAPSMDIVYYSSVSDFIVDANLNMVLQCKDPFAFKPTLLGRWKSTDPARTVPGERYRRALTLIKDNGPSPVATWIKPLIMVKSFNGDFENVDGIAWAGGSICVKLGGYWPTPTRVITRYDTSGNKLDTLMENTGDQPGFGMLLRGWSMDSTDVDTLPPPPANYGRNMEVTGGQFLNAGGAQLFVRDLVGRKFHTTFQANERGEFMCFTVVGNSLWAIWRQYTDPITFHLAQFRTPGALPGEWGDLLPPK